MLTKAPKGDEGCPSGTVQKWQYIEKYIPGDLQKLRN